LESLWSPEFVPIVCDKFHNLADKSPAVFMFFFLKQHSGTLQNGM